MWYIKILWFLKWEESLLTWFFEHFQVGATGSTALAWPRPVSHLMNELHVKQRIVSALVKRKIFPLVFIIPPLGLQSFLGFLTSHATKNEGKLVCLPAFRSKNEQYYRRCLKLLFNNSSISGPFVFTVWLLRFNFHFLASLRCRICLFGPAGCLYF